MTRKIKITPCGALVVKYKIDNIPVKEFEIKFTATLENGEKIELTFPEGAGLTWESIFGKDGNLPLSAIEEDAELHRDEIK